MKHYVKLGSLAVILLVALFHTQATADASQAPCVAGFPTIAEDEATVSLGRFRVWIHPNFRFLFDSNPFYNPTYYDAALGKLESPDLEDLNTKIGVSAMHPHSTNPMDVDVAGATVGLAGTIISDGDFLSPPGFQGGTDPTTYEAHTEIIKFSLQDGVSGLGIRSGSFHGLPSYGEVESIDGDGLDQLPGESFFNVYVEVDLPDLGNPPAALTTLYNPTPLLVKSDRVCPMPPRVVYIHDNSEAVPLVFQSDHPSDPANNWYAGQMLGYIVLAGHGVMDSASYEQFGWGTFPQTFEDAWNDAPEMPLPADIPTLTEWGLIFLGLLLAAWMAWLILRRRRRVTIGA